MPNNAILRKSINDKMKDTNFRRMVVKGVDILQKK